MSSTASPSSAAHSSRSSSPATPESSSDAQPVPGIYNELKLSSWYRTQNLDKSPSSWEIQPSYVSNHNMKCDESDPMPMLGLEELLQKHAYEESPPSASESSSISEVTSSQTHSPQPRPIEHYQMLSDFRPANIIIPSRHGPASVTKPIPPPASRPHKRDTAAKQKVVYPSKGSCMNLPIIVPSIPEGGTKSRVETQVRVTVDLANSLPPPSDPNTYERVGSWKWLKLPPGTSTKRQSRKQGKIDPNPADVLYLTINVTCATAPYSTVTCCHSCQTREAKRVAKKIAARVKPEVSDTDSPDESGNRAKRKKAQHEDTSSIVHFNCAEYLDFATGSVELPLRLTCYCRHHREKIGFNVHFGMVDHQGRMVGSGVSRPIMITDDHKTRAAPSSANGTEFHQLTPIPGHDWARAVAQDKKDSTAPSKRKCSNGTVDAAGTKKRAKPYDRSRASREASVSSAASPSVANSGLPLTRSPSPLQSQTRTMALEEVNDILMGEQLNLGSSPTFENRSPDLDMLDIFNLPNVTMPTSTLEGAYAQNAASPSTSLSPHSTSATIPPNLPFLFFSQPPLSHDQILPPSLPPPAIQRLIPASGPTHGGIEVTILGINFHQGLELKCVFGDIIASSTQRWSDNTLVCILPPRSGPGVVNVWLEGMDKDVQTPAALFTYSDESDRALMELALQVVGLKMTGKIEDAKNVAMRIVGQAGDGSGSSSSSNQQPGSTLALAQMRDIHPMLLSSGDPNAFESLMLDFLALLNLDLEDEAPRSGVSTQQALAHQTGSGQTLLHLAALLGFEELIGFLLERGANVNAKDRNGWTPLHFAALLGGRKGTACSSALLDAGADVEITNYRGNTAQEEAACHGIAFVLEDTSDGSLSSSGRSDDADEAAWGDGEESDDAVILPKRTLRRRLVKTSAKSSSPSTPKDSLPSAPDAIQKSNPPQDKKEPVDDPETQAASILDLIQRTILQLQQHAPEGLKANMPNFQLPQLPYLADRLAMPNVRWGALPNIPMVFPIFVPMPGWPAFLSNDQKEPKEGHVDSAGSKVSQDRTTWEKWLMAIPAANRQVEAPPPEYTPRAEDLMEKLVEKGSVKQPELEQVPIDTNTAVAASSSHPQRNRRKGYDSVPITAREVDSFAYQPTPEQQQKLRKKHDFMLMVFWLPTLILSLIWAGVYGLNIVLQLLKDVLASRAGTA